MAAVTRYAIIMNHCSVLELLHGTIDMTTQLPTAAAGVSGDHSSTLSELHHMMESVPVIMYSLQLKNDLCDVLAEIRSVNQWKELGLQLGLLYSSLERMDIEQRGRIDSCKIAMLSAWLQQQDNVTQKGVPSWSVLRAALQRMRETEPVHHQERETSQRTSKCAVL